MHAIHQLYTELCLSLPTFSQHFVSFFLSFFLLSSIYTRSFLPFSGFPSSLRRPPRFISFPAVKTPSSVSFSSLLSCRQVAPELEESSPHHGIGLAFSSLFPSSSSSLLRQTSGDKDEEEEEERATSSLVDKEERRRIPSAGRPLAGDSPLNLSEEPFTEGDVATLEKEKKKKNRRKFSEKVVLNVREICSTLSQKQRLKTINQFR